MTQLQLLFYRTILIVCYLSLCATSIDMFRILNDDHCTVKLKEEVFSNLNLSTC